METPQNDQDGEAGGDANGGDEEHTPEWYEIHHHVHKHVGNAAGTVHGHVTNVGSTVHGHVTGLAGSGSTTETDGKADDAKGGDEKSPEWYELHKHVGNAAGTVHGHVTNGVGTIHGHVAGLAGSGSTTETD